MKLSELMPRESKLKLKAFKEPFILNAITLADEAWLAEQYGSDGIAEIFEDINIKEISRIVFRLMRIEDKKLFKKRDVTFITEDGEELTVELGGVELLRQSIVGWDEKLKVLNALLENIGVSRPDVKSDTVKKKTTRKKKK